MADEKLLRVKDLVLHFRTLHGAVQAVDGVNIELDYNRAVVILGRAVAGRARWRRRSCACCRATWRSIRGGDPGGAGRDEVGRGGFPAQRALGGHVDGAAGGDERLNPVLRVGEQVSEPAMIHLGMKKEEATQAALKMFQHVGVPADFLSRYPFELERRDAPAGGDRHGAGDLAEPDHPG